MSTPPRSDAAQKSKNLEATSKKRTYRKDTRSSRSKQAASSSVASESRSRSRTPQSSRRAVNVYDAVAGRITTHGFHDAPSSNLPSKNRDTLSHSLAPVAPGEILFRDARAPDRFEEDDIYRAHRHLDPADFNSRLPALDLLKSLHVYVSEFYFASTLDKGGCDWRSLDETALLAMGILIEEAARAVLGNTGDMVFVEGEVDIENAEFAESGLEVSESIRRTGTIRTGAQKSQAELENAMQDIPSTSREGARESRRKKRSYRDFGEDY